MKDGIVSIIGSDNVDGSNQWIIKAKEDFPGTIFVDFSPKGGPSDLLGKCLTTNFVTTVYSISTRSLQ